MGRLALGGAGQGIKERHTRLTESL
jgi:hypothetical protein